MNQRLETLADLGRDLPWPVLWVSSTAVGWGVAALVSWQVEQAADAMVTRSFRLVTTRLAIGAFPAGVVFGALTAAAQGLALRRTVARWDIAWLVLATAVGWGLGGVVAWVDVTLGVALLQWPVVRRWKSRASWWIAVTLAFGVLLRADFLPLEGLLLWGVGGAGGVALRGLLLGVLYGSVTGATLTKLRNKRQKGLHV